MFLGGSLFGTANKRLRTFIRVCYHKQEKIDSTNAVLCNLHICGVAPLLVKFQAVPSPCHAGVCFDTDVGCGAGDRDAQHVQCSASFAAVAVACRRARYAVCVHLARTSSAVLCVSARRWTPSAMPHRLRAHPRPCRVPQLHVTLPLDPRARARGMPECLTLNRKPKTLNPEP